MKYILDTNAVSALMKGDASVLKRLSKESKSDVYIPGPVVAEIAYGIARLPKSKKRESLQERFELIQSEIQRISWTDEVSLRFGEIKATLEKRGLRIEDFDAAIAAHAHEPESVLVSANTDDMIRVPGLHVEDWSKT
ncbi:MAG: type II toxin-antitoxin system VapC family toxin [Polyangiaceae bacterium]